MNDPRPPTVLLVDDDEEDRAQIGEALVQAMPGVRIQSLRDGQELLDYLRATGDVTSESSRVRPGLILLDLNMPRMDGREALRLIKTDPSLRGIPVVVLTVSNGESDIWESYDQGVAGFVTKPTTIDELTEVVRTLGVYWLRTVHLPPEGAA
jgi:CheY-like chemotaxis protein